jgi:hypothetical protein
VADGAGVGAEIAGEDGIGIEAAEGAGGQAHVGGIEEYRDIGMEAADEAGEILGGGGGVDAAPIRMPEGAGEDGPEGVIAVAGIADAEEEVHGKGTNGISEQNVGQGSETSWSFPLFHHSMTPTFQ